MIEVPTIRYELHDWELKKLLGLPRKAEIKTVEFKPYHGGGAISFVVITAQRPARRRVLA